MANPSRTRRRAAIALATLAASTLALVRSLPASVAAAPEREGAATHAQHGRSEKLHDVHLSYSRVVVDGTSILWRVRLFRDDLERALRAQSGDTTSRADSRTADSLFAAYFNARVPVSANGRRLTGRVVQSGRDPDVSDSEMWWYLVELRAPATVATFSTRVGLLFEHFSDQRNVLTLLKMPGESRHSMYFVRDDVREQSLTF